MSKGKQGREVLRLMRTAKKMAENQKGHKLESWHRRSRHWLSSCTACPAKVAVRAGGVFGYMTDDPNLLTLEENPKHAIAGRAVSEMCPVAEVADEVTLETNRPLTCSR